MTNKPTEIRFISFDGESLDELFLDAYKAVPLKYEVKELTEKEVEEEALKVIINAIY